MTQLSLNYFLLMSKERLEAFSDGVFAVALTLLVLDLHVPSIKNHSSFQQYIEAIMPIIPNIISFVLSFILIAIHWVSHHYFFSHLRNIPLALVWLNNLFLLWICFMPFPTTMLGEHATDQFPVLLYGINQLLAALTFFAFRDYARKNRLFSDPAIAKAMGPRHSIPAIIAFTASILFVFISVYVSLVCFIIVPLLYFMPNFLESKIFRSNVK
jgi:uncharacterized membrane protein